MPPKPAPNFGFGKLVLNGTLDAIKANDYLDKAAKCYHDYYDFYDFHAKIFDKAVSETLKNLIFNLMSCHQFNDIEDQDK